MELLHRFVEFQENFTGEQFVEWAQAHAEIPVYAVVLYLSFVFSVPEWMKGREPFRLRGCFALWNLFLTVFSWTGAIHTVPYMYRVVTTKGFKYTVCTDPYEWYSHGPVGFWLGLFIFSKIPELIDTVFLVFQKKPVIFLHWFHHTTVLLYCWHAFHTTVGPGLWFATMNYSVHAIMYFYYFLMTFRNSSKIIGRTLKTFAPFITACQLTQMVVGAFVTAMAAYWTATEGIENCHVDPANYKLGLGMYCSYFCLFAMLFNSLYLSGSKKPESNGGPKKHIGPEETVCGVDVSGGDAAGMFRTNRAASDASHASSGKKDQ
mmetsp:Transcript_56196/g.93401  ORF Transcript_56196/g.93401 Transcript_56196/m.93401 type:complete len:319 (-) Transcript_56196:1268-2224(-)|eukprot:CAMPEP_0174287498 /NCGR_PEP_ID=MMETSP0809-20121228/16131_1 /TAXON_ID=73025 ORGANISM="Eutreptiella gymnastica-like, Strain CCMP1594" /NCGR_SAMPLE_ID=MMETSP0809 /ASSEMBLY_ACC=CAM_ASM_000658 /LENGTH=318 /DNA_ID=CAMNT_0015384065 /DNA_START=44 /DNA_END=1000 /DNA_ORIENTATION=+